jgi:two-component system response regulator RegA
MSSLPDAARSLLIVEDDDRLRERLARALGERGYDTREAADYDRALALAREDSPEYLLVDLRIPGGRSGLDVVRDVKAIDPSTVVVVLTGYGSIATAVEAVRLGAAEYLTKPADVDQIIAAFSRGGEGAHADLAEPPDGPDRVPSLARVEWEHINRVLADCGGNVSKAARLLGIHRRSLQRKLERFPTAR